jgi:hypothetical protein
MNDRDRFFIRQRQNWQHLQRLGVIAVFCPECSEIDPRCFIGELARSVIKDGTLHALCERCKRKSFAPRDADSINKKWALLKKAGVTNSRCQCGEDNPFCLEADHLDGRKSSQRVIGRCINCHLKRTSRQLTEYPRDKIDPQNPRIVMRNRVRGTIEDLELAVAGLRSVEEFLHNMEVGQSDSSQE